MSRAGFEPAQARLKASCPTVLGDRLAWAPADLDGHFLVPSQGCCQVTPRARRCLAGLAAALGQRSHRRIGGATTGGRGTRRASTRGTSARGAGSPSSVSSGIKSPPFPWFVIGAERVERSPRVLQTRMQPLHHAPFPETAEHGEHPLSIWEARHGPFRIFRRGDAGHGRSRSGEPRYINVSSKAAEP